MNAPAATTSAITMCQRRLRCIDSLTESAFAVVLMLFMIGSGLELRGGNGHEVT